MPSNDLVRCPRCGGTRVRRGSVHTWECFTCNGTGKVPADSPAFDQ